MANLEAIIAEKSQQDTQWRAEMQADRENTISLQDAGVEEITSNPELYVKYLDMQGITQHTAQATSPWSCSRTRRPPYSVRRNGGKP